MKPIDNLVDISPNESSLDPAPRTNLHPYPSPGDVQREATLRDRSEKLPPWRPSVSILHDMPEDKPRSRLRSRMRAVPKIAGNPMPTKKQKVETLPPMEDPANPIRRSKAATQKKRGQGDDKERKALSELKNSNVNNPLPNKTLASLLKDAAKAPKWSKEGGENIEDC